MLNRRRTIAATILALSFLVTSAALSQDPGPLTGPEVFGGRLERPAAKKVKQFEAEAAASLAEVPAFLPQTQSEGTEPTTAASPDDPKFSWRAGGYVTAARSQSNCGSCYVFGGIAALEANWAIRHNKQMIDASEQQVLNCTSGSCSTGGYNSSTMSYLVNTGTCTETDNTYVAAKKTCTPRTIAYRGVARAYVDPQGGQPSRRALKQAIIEHGPVSAFVYAGGFGNYYNTDRVVDTPSSSGPHIVLIVGWDDTKQHSLGRGAWEIKNSWGTAWGRNGFGFVAYGIRRIGDNAIWIETQPGTVGPEFIPLSRRALDK
jgi:C1A family cysteine protease